MKSASVRYRYDPEKPTTPTLDLDFPRLSEEEAKKVSDYLLHGKVFWAQRVFSADLVSGEERKVPVSRYTDGTWVWQGSLPYYVDRYRLAPADDFLQYLRSVDYSHDFAVTQDDLERARSFSRVR